VIWILFEPREGLRGAGQAGAGEGDRLSLHRLLGNGIVNSKEDADESRGDVQDEPRVRKLKFLAEEEAESSENGQDLRRSSLARISIVSVRDMTLRTFFSLGEIDLNKASALNSPQSPPQSIE
jgi:hypothetical protein